MISAFPGLALASTHHAAGVRVIVARHLVRPRHTVVVRAKSQGLRGPLEYGFRVTTAAGRQVALRRMAKNSRFSFKPVRPGTYWIQARVMTAKAAREKAWKQDTVSTLSVVYVGRGPSLSLSSPSVAVGGTVKLIAHAGSIAHPQYKWEYRAAGGRWIAKSKFSTKTTTSLAPAKPGPYQAKLLAKTPGGSVVASSPANFSIYGAPSAIAFTTSQKTWVADGKETEVLTASVVDGQGDIVTDYQGAGTLTDQTANGAISEWGASSTSLSPATTGATLPLTFVNGQAKVVLQAGTTAASDSLTATRTASASQILNGKATIAAVAQKATAIRLTTSDKYIIANESGNPATYNLSMVDQVGEPMLTGTYTLTADIAGPGQFQDLTQGPDTITYTGGEGPAPITLLSIAGALGKMTLTVSANGFSAKRITIPAILGGQPAQMGISGANTTLKDGQSTTLTLTQLTDSGGVSDPASLDNSGYVVSITDANGNPASGFSLDGAPYVGASQSFAVAIGPNYFYAVSQPVTLTVTSAPPGTYSIVVADADGLWKTSNPLTISVTK